MNKLFRFIVVFVVGVVFILCSLCLINFYALDGASLEAGKKNGEPIIRALEQYHKDYETYPTQLFYLVPEYLNSVPQPAWRYQYTLETCSSDSSYVLWFRRANDVDTYCGYVSFIHTWKCSDSIPPECETKK